MNELPPLRRIIFGLSAAIVIIQPLYFLFLTVSMSIFHDQAPSDSLWEHMITTGLKGSLLSLVGGLFGRGWRRLAVPLAAAFEAMCCVFLSVGL